jgi:hypothetical protein
MYKLIETSEKLELSIPIIGSSIIDILTSTTKRLTVYDLLEKVHSQNPKFGENRVIQSLLFLFTLDTIVLNGAFLEVKCENK